MIWNETVESWKSWAFGVGARLFRPRFFCRRGSDRKAGDPWSKFHLINFLGVANSNRRRTGVVVRTRVCFPGFPASGTQDEEKRNSRGREGERGELQGEREKAKANPGTEESLSVCVSRSNLCTHMAPLFQRPFKFNVKSVCFLFFRSLSRSSYCHCCYYRCYEWSASSLSLGNPSGDSVCSTLVDVSSKKYVDYHGGCRRASSSSEREKERERVEAMQMSNSGGRCH